MVDSQSERDDPEMLWGFRVPPELTADQMRDAVRVISEWEGGDSLPEELVVALLPILGRHTRLC